MKVISTFLLILCAITYNSVSANPNYSTPNYITYQVFKGDPFIVKAYKELYKRSPNIWELNIFNYNNGSWSSYEYARKYVQDFQTSMQRQNVKFAFGPAKSKSQVVVGLIVNNQLIAADVIGTAGGYIVTSGGSNVIKQGGTKVTLDGKSFKITPETAGFSFGAADAPKGTQRFLTTGPGAILVKK